MDNWTLARTIFLAKEKYHWKVTRLSIILFDSELTFIG